MQVNRYLNNNAMDRIDHALGRPLDPTMETYRDFYATGDADLAKEMTASPHWRAGVRGRELRYFHVTDEGRKALARYLREIGDPHRAFTVTFDGYTQTVIAASRDKARYSYFLTVAEVVPDLTFLDYCRRTSVVAA